MPTATSAGSSRLRHAARSPIFAPRAGVEATASEVSTISCRSTMPLLVLESAVRRGAMSAAGGAHVSPTERACGQQEDGHASEGGDIRSGRPAEVDADDV